MDKKMILKNWLYSLPKGEYDKKEAEIISACLIDKTTYYRWKIGQRYPRPLYRKIINKVANKRLYEDI